VVAAVPAGGALHGQQPGFLGRQQRRAAEPQHAAGLAHGESPSDRHTALRSNRAHVFGRDLSEPSRDDLNRHPHEWYSSHGGRATAAPAIRMGAVLDGSAGFARQEVTVVDPREATVPDLTGQVALVTGAARGQGRSHCLALAACGADIAALDVCRDLDVPRYPLATRAELDEVVAAVEGVGRRALPLVADVRDGGEVAAAVAAVGDAFGRLDILVNNAAVVTSAPFWELSEAQWTAVVDTNLSGVWRTTAAAVDLLRRSPRGRIVNIASTGGVRAVPE